MKVFWLLSPPVYTFKISVIGSALGSPPSTESFVMASASVYESSPAYNHEIVSEPQTVVFWTSLKIKNGVAEFVGSGAVVIGRDGVGVKKDKVESGSSCGSGARASNVSALTGTDKAKNPMRRPARRAQQRPQRKGRK